MRRLLAISLLLIPLAPWTLERAARTAKLWHCIALNVVSVMTLAPAVLASYVASINEPFGSTSDFADAATQALAPSCLLTLMAYVVFAAGFICLVTSRRPVREHQRAQFCVILLSPLTLALPILVWIAAATASSVPGHGISLQRGVPVWLIEFARTLVGLAGSPLWLPIGLGIALAFGIRTFRRMRPRPGDPNTCSHCFYPLSSLPPNAPCPECGTQCSNLTSKTSNDRTPL